MKKEEIKEIVDMFSAANIGKIKIKNADFEITLEKYNEASAPAVQACPPTNPINVSVVNEAKPTPKAAADNTINSPMVGTFYQAPSPGASPFVKVGQSVKKGDTICIIEAMKIMNEIEAEFDCRIVEKLVEDGQPVEFGMALYTVEKL